jgi:hypothetical protein
MAGVILATVMALVAPWATGAGQPRPPLIIELVIAAGSDARLEQWALHQGAELETVTEFRPGQPVVAQARIAGCDPGDRQRCDVSVQYVVHGPGGTVYHQEPSRPAETGTPAPAMRFAFTDADPAGLYRIVVTVRDLNAKRLSRVERIVGLRVTP